jgi:starch-binding outer membrane protein, SusD/RagB family
MNIKKYLILLGLISLVSACEDPFEMKPHDKFDVEFIFSVTKKADFYVLNTYKVLPYPNSDNNGYNRLSSGQSMIASASDEAMPNIPGYAVEYLTNGSLNPSSPNPDNTWDHNYEFIRAINIGLENLYLMPASGAETKTKLEGELIFLRAFAHFELVKRFGGVPIIDKVLSIGGSLDIPRNTYAECIKFIADELDRAVPLLPGAAERADTEFGRISSGAAMALKSRVLLYAASPLFNGLGYDDTQNSLIGYGDFSAQRWESAAAAAADVIKLNYYALYAPSAITNDQDDATVRTNAEKNYTDLFLTLSGNKELILTTNSALGNMVEKKNTPVGYTAGEGSTNPSQQMVNAYGMINGKSILDATGGYDPANPYLNRDPRFNVSIFYNGKTWGTREVETFVGGRDNAIATTNATKTGYYLSKFMSSAVRISGAQTNATHCFPLMRYAEILLNYAEAANEAYGPDADPLSTGKTARQALQEVRARVLRPADAAINTPSGGKNEMREAIKAERRVELAFEDHRHLDVRRWKIAQETIGQNLQGMRITKEGTVLTYEVIPNASTRVFQPRMYLYPIPIDEINKNKAMVQNPLW